MAGRRGNTSKAMPGAFACFEDDTPVFQRQHGLEAFTAVTAPRVGVQSSPECYTLQAALELDRLSNLPSGDRWRLGLSAVIEEANGRTSYWALAYPPGKADFHHSDCFTLELPPA